MFNRGALTECPVCQGLDPDPRGYGFCGLCGAVYRNQVSSSLRLAKTAVALGIVLLLAASIVTLGLGISKPLGLALSIVGALLLALGVYLSRRTAQAMLSALGLRTAPETMRFLRSTNRLNLFVLAFALLGLLASGPYYVRVARPRQEQAVYKARFTAHMSDYLSLVPPDAPVPEETAPYINGKVVVIDKTEQGGEISEVHRLLPVDLRAESPDEVGTVVLINWRDVRAGTYGESGIVAYTVAADVTVIDAAKKEIITQETFAGGPPPGTAPPGGGPGRGSRPVEKIAARLEEIARQAANGESESSEPVLDQ